MGAPEVQAFISFLAVERHVAASTQKQALSAVLFLYRHVLNQPVEVPDILRPETVGHLPTVLTHPEAMLVIDKMSGTSRLMAKLLYGSGLGLMECLRLRVKDVDFGNHQIIVRDGKGEKRPGNLAAGFAFSNIASPSFGCKSPSPKGFEGWVWGSYPSVCTGSEIPACRQGMVLAVYFSSLSAFQGSALGQDQVPSSG
jgi:hypothetical protein